MKIEEKNIVLFPIDSIIDESLLEENFEEHSTMISMNENINIDFIRKYKERLDWKTISINYQFSEDELIELHGWISWGSAIYCQNACTKEFIEDNNLTSIVEGFEKHNREFITQSNEQYGNIENTLMIGESNKDIAYAILISRINSRLSFYDNLFVGLEGDNHMEFVFDDNHIFHVKYSRLDEMKRDLQIEIVLGDDNIIKSIRNVVEKYDTECVIIESKSS